MTIFIVAPANPRRRDADGNGAESFDKDRSPSKFYRNKGHAETMAKQMAAKYPGELFSVLKVDSIFEAKQPEIMEKALNDQGEIVPRG